MPPEQIPRSKKEETRKSGLACCNVTGLRKYSITFIDKAGKRRCFNKKSEVHLDINYYNNTKFWMISGLLFEWLKRFNKYIKEKNGLQPLLVIDNCLALETNSNLSFFQVEFLPLNFFAELQSSKWSFEGYRGSVS